MDSYYEEIFEDLDKFPSPTSPGSLIVSGDSIPLIAYPNAGDIVFAAAEYGFGKLCVFAHDCYLNWLQEKYENKESVRYKFMTNLKVWLASGRALSDEECQESEDTEVLDSEIGDLASLLRSTSSPNQLDLNKYKIIKFHHDVNIDGTFQQKLLDYMQDGGGLICASTPWGYLQIYSKSNLNDMCLYNFLKDNFGILFKSNCLYFPDELELSKNKAHHSHFDSSMNKLKLASTNSSEHEISTDLCHTIASGLDELYNEGILNENDLTNINKTIQDHCSCCRMNLVPSKTCEVKDKKAKNLALLMSKCHCKIENSKAPGIEHFPGDYNDESPELLSNVEVELETKFAERLSTGYYLAAGTTLIVEVISPSSSADLAGWSVRIGAHSDNLEGCETLRRWPNICLTKSLISPAISLSSPYGGLIYFESSAKGGSIKVSLTNVIESPYIDLNLPHTLDDWQRRKNAPGLWAELAGELIVFTTPSKCIRHIENPIEVLKFWDSVVRTHHECRGTNAYDYKRERVVNDEQPSAGYMHSGYPIVTHLDCCESNHNECIFDLEKLKKDGNWGLFHEIGHNLQRDAWTFDGSGEVTVNIFSMHATQFVIGQDVLDQKWPRHVQSRFQAYFSREPTYDDWKANCDIALMTFVQLIKYFGWTPMHTFMKNYEADLKSGNNLPRSNQEKIDQWVIRYSKLVSHNIKPQFEMFGLPVSAEVDKHVGHLPQFVPSDEKDGQKFFTPI